jgi:hypothetical protein
MDDVTWQDVWFQTPKLNILSVGNIAVSEDRNATAVMTGPVQIIKLLPGVSRWNLTLLQRTERLDNSVRGKAFSGQHHSSNFQFS